MGVVKGNPRIRGVRKATLGRRTSWFGCSGEPRGLLPHELVIADFGHGDLFQADDARTLVWEPLLTWLAAH